MRHLAEQAIDAANRTGARNSTGERFAVHVTIEAQVLAGYLRGAGILDDNTPIDVHTIRGWLQHATLGGAILDKGRPLHLGRTRRTATAAQRRALLIRDRGCAYPGCDQTRHLHAHHNSAWEQGGVTDIEHLSHLCGTHHRSYHRGEYTITSNPDGSLVFATPTGDPIAVPATTPSPQPLTSHSPNTTRTGEPLTNYALDTLLHHLFAAGAPSTTDAAGTPGTPGTAGTPGTPGTPGTKAA